MVRGLVQQPPGLLDVAHEGGSSREAIHSTPLFATTFATSTTTAAAAAVVAAAVVATLSTQLPLQQHLSAGIGLAEGFQFGQGAGAEVNIFPRAIEQIAEEKRDLPATGDEVGAQLITEGHLLAKETFRCIAVATITRADAVGTPTTTTIAADAFTAVLITGITTIAAAAVAAAAHDESASSRLTAAA